jgi:nuclease S1
MLMPSAASADTELTPLSECLGRAALQTGSIPAAKMLSSVQMPVFSDLSERLGTGQTDDYASIEHPRAKPTIQGRFLSTHQTAGPGQRRALPVVPAVAAAFLLLFMGQPAQAWGPRGHRASAKLAEARLSPRARAIIRELLEPGESLADASTWADENNRVIAGSAAWHFVNVPVSADHYDPRDCRPRGCVVSKIAEFRSILADSHAPRSRRRTALRFFVHLVQDLHQPMHVADRNDRGGNNLQLRYGRYDNTNLHQVWDSGLLNQGYRNEAELLRTMDNLALRPAAGPWLKGQIEDWADESLEVGRRAYLIPGTNSILRTGDSIGRDYERANVPLVTDRLARSGVRLAFLLNEILK